MLCVQRTRQAKRIFPQNGNMPVKPVNTPDGLQMKKGCFKKHPFRLKNPVLSKCEQDKYQFGSFMGDGDVNFKKVSFFPQIRGNARN